MIGVGCLVSVYFESCRRSEWRSFYTDKINCFQSLGDIQGEFVNGACVWACGWVVVWWLCCVYRSGLCRCSNHCCTGVCHCWNLTLSADLTGVRVLCCGIDSTDGSSLVGSKNGDDSGDSSLIRGCGISGCGDSGGVKKFSTSVDSCLGISGSSANVLRNWYSSNAHSNDLRLMWTSLGSKHFLSRLYCISGMCPMCMSQYIWYVLSVHLGVTKCPAPYMLLMYQVRSSGAEIGIRPGASRIGVDVVVWAIVSECSVDGKELFFKGVWLSVCDFISEEDFVEKFSFVLANGVVVEVVVCYCKILSVIFLSKFKNVPNFQ